jgi:hypothetical protein
MISCGSSLCCYGHRRSTPGPTLLSSFGSPIVSRFLSSLFVDRQRIQADDAAISSKSTGWLVG